MRSFFLSRNAIPVHLAFIAGYLACVTSRPEGIASYLPLAWFIAGLIEVMLLFPSARKGEDPMMARSRVRKSIFRDPVFSLSLMGFFFLLIQTLNGPRNALFNPGTGKWFYTNPPVPDFPSCIERLLSLQGLFWVLIASTVLLAFRNCIGKKGRKTLLRYLAYISGVISAVTLFRYAASSLSPDAGTGDFSFFNSGAEAGAYFIMHFCISVALLLHQIDGDTAPGKPILPLSVSAALNAAGVFYSFSCEVIFTFFIVLLFAVFYAVPYMAKRIPAGTLIKVLASVLSIVGIALFLNFIAYPGSRVNKTFQTLTSWTWHDEAALKENAAVERVGWRIFGDNSLFGVGAWCTGITTPVVTEDDNDEEQPAEKKALYAVDPVRSLFGKYIEESEWEDFRDEEAASGIRVFNNDFLQFLCEFGIIGTLLISSPFIYLLVCALVGIVRASLPAGAGKDSAAGSSVNEVTPFQDRVVPVVYFSFIAIAASVVLSLRLTVFHSPVVIFTYSILFASLVSFLPKFKKSSEIVERAPLFRAKNANPGFDSRSQTGKIED